MRVRSLAAVVVALSALGLAACGDKDFENNPRPPAPISLSARIADHGVSVGPQDVGAGVANITISNQSADPATLVLDGPTQESSGEIVAGGTGSIKVELKEGDYQVSSGNGGGGAAKLTVGPTRPSSQNDLLLP
jgi:hypothetical protein